MGLKGLTVNTAPEAEPHIYAEDDAAIYQAICGSDGVFDIGQKCESQVISNNKVRVKDGVIIVGGHFARIPYGDYIDFEIANGQAGKKRNDILIAKFTTTGSGGIDTFTGEVKQGAASTEEATDPALTQNDLYQGGKIREMPLYRVKLDGLSITKVEPMFDLIPTIPTLNKYLSELLADSGWISMASSVSFASKPAFRKVGKTVFVKGSVRYSDNGTFRNDEIIGQIPEGFEPSSSYSNYECIIPFAFCSGTGTDERIYIIGRNVYFAGTVGAKDGILASSCYITD